METYMKSTMTEKQEQSRQNISGKVDKGDEGGSGSGGEGGGSSLDKIIKASPKITARYEEITATIIASASIEAPGKLVKMELIKNEQILTKETKTENLEKDQTFNVKEYGAGWYKVKITAKVGEKERVKNAWVRAINLDKAIDKPDITIEPVSPNGEGSWYKRTIDKQTEVDKETEIKVIISTTNNKAECIYYKAIGGHNETREEENPVAGKIAEFTMKESGITMITARVGAGGNSSLPSTKTIKLDNIKPEILEGEEGITIIPTPRRSRQFRKKLDKFRRKNKYKSDRQRRRKPEK